MKPKNIFLSLFCFLTSSQIAGSFCTIENISGSNAAFSNIIKERTLKMNSPDSLLFQDYSEHFKLVYREGAGFVACGKSGETLFTIFPYDNGPDYPSDGLFRIIENGKIGFADLTGKVVIKPAYDAALPFTEGLAAFCNECQIVEEGEHKTWRGGNWGFINKSGEIVIEPQFEKIISGFTNDWAEVVSKGKRITINRRGDQIQVKEMNYKKWTMLLGDAMRSVCGIIPGGRININLKWSDEKENYGFVLTGPELLDAEILLNDKPAVRYFLIPWQNFSIKSYETESPDQLVADKLMTVTDYAIIYKRDYNVELSEKEKEYLRDFNESFESLIELDANEIPEEDEYLNIPDGIQLISLNSFSNYFELNVALPGSQLPEQNRWSIVSEFKMLRLFLTPDIGAVKENWFKPEAKPSFQYHQAECDLLEIFEKAIAESLKQPETRRNIYQKYKSELNELFSNAESYSGFLYQKYSELLLKWLMIVDEPVKETIPEELFGDYQRKDTPDTVIDYMPQIADELLQIPVAEIGNFAELYTLLNYYQGEALKNPGYWEDGNIVLGAKEKEYKPSLCELLASEAGERLKAIIDSEKHENLKKILDDWKMLPFSAEYIKYTFIHIDVMGSGRFFYVDAIEKVKLEL